MLVGQSIFLFQSFLMDIDWIKDEFAELDLGDKRLNERFIETASQLFLSPDETINKSMEEFSDKKAAYRLFSNKKFKTDEMFECHQRQTAKRVSQYKRAIAIHDTSFFSFNTKRSIKDLGNINGDNTHGFIGHYTLSMSTTGVPLGLLGLMPWSRYYESPWEKESDRWSESFTESDRLCEGGTELIHLADREADIFDLHYTNLKENRLFVIRSSHDRMIEGGDHYLSWHLNKKKVRSEASIYYEKEDRNLAASVKFGQVTFTDPGLRHTPGLLRSQVRQVTLNVVEIKSEEKIIKKGVEEELRWVLFTNLPVNDLAEALKVVEYYRMRWHIESYFKVLKGGGCKVEKCCLRTFERLVKYASLFSIIAWKLYSVKHLSEVRPDEEFSAGFTREERIILNIGAKKALDSTMSMHEAMRTVGKLGGFNGRKGDGSPGMVSLWRGFVKLQTKVELFKEFEALDLLKI